MGFKKKALIGLMALSLAGTVGSVLALTSVGANKTVNAGLDSAIYLYWGEGSTSATIENVTDLAPGVAQYRELTVAPRASASVAGTLTVNFAITCGEDNSVNGLSFKVFETTEFSAEAKAVAIAAAPKAQLSAAANVDMEITISAGVETTKLYYLSFEYDGTMQAEGKTFGGQMTISQSFAA